jgi:hypothetical protein
MCKLNPPSSDYLVCLDFKETNLPKLFGINSNFGGQNMPQIANTKYSLNMQKNENIAI